MRWSIERVNEFNGDNCEAGGHGDLRPSLFPVGERHLVESSAKDK